MLDRSHEPGSQSQVSKKLPLRSMTSVRRACMMLPCDEQGKGRCHGAQESTRRLRPGALPRLQRSDHRCVDFTGWTLSVSPQVLAADRVSHRAELTPRRILISVHHATGSLSHSVGSVPGLVTSGMCEVWPLGHSRWSTSRPGDWGVEESGPARFRQTATLRSWRSSWPQAGQVIVVGAPPPPAPPRRGP